MARVYADINPDVLEWARKRARYDRALLAAKVGVKADRYGWWETGEAKPTLRQLGVLVRLLHQPLQTFFMSDVPDEPEALAGMRRLPGSRIGQESPELATQVDLAIERRAIALRLYRELREEPPSLNMTAALTRRPEEIAGSIRETLGVTIEEQESWKKPHKAIRGWRAALESAGVLVFQVPGVELSEMRGFAFATRPLPIIGINSKDSPRGRIFTIFHELTHILLNETFLDPGGRGWFDIGPAFKVEHFCNRVAAATLVPAEDLLSQARAIGKIGQDVWSDAEVADMALRYQVSRAVMIRRLRNLQLIAKAAFEQLCGEYDSFVPPQKIEGGGNVYANRIAHLGTLIPVLAFRAYYDNRATVSDLSSLFGLKAKNLGRLEERVFGFNYGFGGS